jgi:hypothetical protein
LYFGVVLGRCRQRSSQRQDGARGAEKKTIHVSIHRVAQASTPLAWAYNWGADTVVRPRFRLRRKCRTDVLPGDGKAGVEAGRATCVAVSQPQKKQLFDNDFALELGCNALMTLI